MRYSRSQKWRILIHAPVDSATAALAIATPALAQIAATATSAAKAKYSTAESDLGTLLDNSAAKAIIEKHIPGMTTNEQVDMARGMTLRAVQQYASEEVTDARLAAIDADLTKLP